MAELLATMPVLPLTSDCVVKFEAINPTTGAAVSGVTVSQAVIYAVDIEGESSGGSVDSGPFMLVPGPTPVGPSGGPPLVIRGGL